MKKPVLIALASFVTTLLIIAITYFALKNNNAQNDGDKHQPIESSASTHTDSLSSTQSDSEIKAADKSMQNQPKELKFTSATSDFTLGNQAGNSYKASNLIDGNPATAWAATLSSNLVWESDIVGPILKLSKPSHISAIEITNGYCKNSTAFHNNTRAAWIEVARWHPNLDGEYAEGQYEGSERRDVIYSGPISDTMSPQRFQANASFDNSKPTSHIVIRFKDPANKSAYYAGSKYNDLCISEFKAFGD